MSVSLYRRSVDQICTYIRSHKHSISNRYCNPTLMKNNLNTTLILTLASTDRSRSYQTAKKNSPKQQSIRTLMRTRKGRKMYEITDINSKTSFTLQLNRRRLVAQRQVTGPQFPRVYEESVVVKSKCHNL